MKYTFFIIFGIFLGYTASAQVDLSELLIHENISELINYDFGECTERSPPAVQVEWWANNRELFLSPDFEKAYPILCREYSNDITKGFVMLHYANQLRAIGDYNNAQKAYLYGAKISNAWKTENLISASILTLFQLNDPVNALTLLSKSLLSITRINKGFGFYSSNVSISQEEAIQYYAVFLTINPEYDRVYGERVRNIRLSTGLNRNRLDEAAIIITQSIINDRRNYDKMLETLSKYNDMIIELLFSL